jgi:nuclear GTP-binding protein
MGLPNSGKTTLLNALLSPTAKKHEVAPATGGNSTSAKHPEPTTKMPVETRVDVGEGKAVSIIDTPGWELVEDEPEDDDEEDDEEDEGEMSDTMDKWDLLEERVAGDLLRRNLGRVDKVKDIFPLGKS